MDSITQTIRAKLFAGVATLLPLYLTYVVIRFLFESLEEMSGPILERFGLGIPGLGLILTIILIYLLGIIVTNFLGRKIFNLGESIVKRVPIVSMIYTTLKQITDTFTKGTTDAFDGVVYIQYPRQGLWTMAFISGKSKNKDEVPYFHLFVPTTPNPTSGFFLMIPQADTISTGMTVEEGLKTIISGGLLAPSKNPLP